jgi:hypothetical protein
LRPDFPPAFLETVNRRDAEAQRRREIKIAKTFSLCLCGADDVHKDAHEGCFSGAIWAQQTEDFALTNLEGDAAQRFILED